MFVHVVFKFLGFSDDIHDCSFKFCILGLILVILISIELVDLGGGREQQRGFQFRSKQKGMQDLLGVVCGLIYPIYAEECEGVVLGQSKAVIKAGKHTG